MFKMHLIFSKKGSISLLALMFSIVLVSFLAGLRTIVKANYYASAVYKKSSEVEANYLEHFEQNLINPKFCSEKFCIKDTTGKCEVFPQRGTITVDHKFQDSGSLDSIDFSRLNLDINQYKDTLSFEAILGCKPPFIQTSTLPTCPVNYWIRYKKNPRNVTSGIGFVKRYIYSININYSIYIGSQRKQLKREKDVALVVHLDRTNRFVGCYRADPLATPYLCEQTKNRVWSFKTQAREYKCQPYNSCLTKKQTICQLPYKTNPIAVLSDGTSGSAIINFDTTPFFKLCLWCGFENEL